MSGEDATYRHLLEDAVHSLPAAPPPGRFSGRGIVLCAGGDVYFPCAWICISALRRAGCELPIELWYRGPREMTTAAIDLLAGSDVTCVDAQEVARRENYPRLDTWEIKVLAIACSRFEEVLYLDADNVPLRDPAFLFDCDAYREHGALFWSDRFRGRAGIAWLKPETWELCGVPWRAEPEIEAGQLVVDKSRCWAPLALTLFFNGHSVYYYRFFYGDKDTFHLAWRRIGAEYALVPHPPRDLGHTQGLLQHGVDGAPLFEHRCGDKWSLTHVNRSIPGFRTEAMCRAWLEELRGRWSPPMRSFPEELSTRERGAYEDVCAARIFDHRVGRRSYRVELLPDFTVAGSTAAVWMVEEDHRGTMTLAIGPQGAPAILRKDDGAVWRGHAFRSRHRPAVELRPTVSDLP